MKIGIITFNRAINYGAVLQSYALKHSLIKTGRNCKIINYKCDEIEKETSPFYIKSFALKNMVIFLLQIKTKWVKNKKFRKFSDKYLDTTEKLVTRDSIGELSDEYDLLITGSDQVWNYEITNLDPNYFLKFANKTCKTASYAASFGVSKIPSELTEKYDSLLKNIQTISVRESAGKALIENICNRESYVHIDPVFLLNKQEWEEIAVSPINKEDYILVYSINKAGCYQMAEKIAKETGLQIVGLQTPLSNKVKCHVIRDESPQEFLGWFKNAKYIITDSFHGTAFSIIFNKRFLLCDGGEGVNRQSRQKTLLETMNISERMVPMKDYTKIYETIDYNMVNDKICMEREYAMQYLNQICQ